MAKVNLLTIHFGQCFGAVLQTYSTCCLLEQAGHSVVVINLIDPNQRGNYKRISYWKNSFREFQFWIFKKKYFSKLTNKAYTIQDISLPEADYTIVGSDQVWNRDITGGFGKTFFLDFVYKQPKIALSSSFGKSIWLEDQQYTTEVKELLKQFKVISVRENSGVDILHDIFNLRAINLPDPTIGYGKFDDLLLNNKPIRKIYPFLLVPNYKAMEIVTCISHELDMPILKLNKFKLKFCNGPRAWLTRIKNADYIITDSFHGLALSVIFNKQFYVLCADEKKFTRLKSLLQILSLDDRFILSCEDFIERKEMLTRPINYNKVNEILYNLKRSYSEFICRFI